MTQDEIIDELRYVVANNQRFTIATWTVSTPHLVELVNRAVQREREACAKECEHTALRMGSEWMAQPVEHIVHSNGRYSPLLTRMMNKRNESNIKQTIDLYDSPEQADKQEPWVGLTVDEIEAYYSWEDFQVGCGRQTLFDMIRDIETKLKEKNGYAEEKNT